MLHSISDAPGRPTCTERQRLEERGEIDALRARYPGLRRYLPAFFGHCQLHDKTPDKLGKHLTIDPQIPYIFLVHGRQGKFQEIVCPPVS
jgi:hypothetical protein